MITATMVKELRERSGAGMMECKKALTESDGDMDAAIEALRKKGAAKADQKSGRVAVEGTVSYLVSEDRKRGVLVEINCETDFVAKDENFKQFAHAVTETIMARDPQDVETLNAMQLAGSEGTVEEARIALFAKIGENLSVRRFAVVDAVDEETVSAYLHGTRIGVLVKSQGGRVDLGKDIAMHVAASRPLSVSRDGVPEEMIAKEREIFMAQAMESGKPEDIVGKIVEGRIRKFLGEITLLGQPYVKDPDQIVEKLLASEDAKVLEFVRYEVGEGLERKEDDFVAEVMAQAKGG